MGERDGVARHSYQDVKILLRSVLNPEALGSLRALNPPALYTRRSRRRVSCGVQLLRHSVNSPHQVCGRGIEPKRSNTDVPLRLAGADAQLTQLYALPPGQLKTHRVARGVGVVSFRALGERVDHLALVHASFG